MVTVHQGNNKERHKTWFDNANTNGAKYGVIGLSYCSFWLDGHPDYTQSINDLRINLIDLVARCSNGVMIVEAGGEVIKPQNIYDMLVAVKQKVKAVEDNKGLGVNYWEPEGQEAGATML